MRFFMGKSRTELEIDNRAMQYALAAARADSDYWRDKAEKLLDAALFKRGEVTMPVFSKPERRAPSTVHDFMSALRVTEITTAKPAEPVTPMK